MNRLKELRKTTGLTQKSFSKEIGIPLRTLQNWENGESQIKPDKAQQLADFFGVSVGIYWAILTKSTQRQNYWISLSQKATYCNQRLISASAS